MIVTPNVYVCPTELDVGVPRTTPRDMSMTMPGGRLPVPRRHVSGRFADELPELVTTQRLEPYAAVARAFGIVKLAGD